MKKLSKSESLPQIWNLHEIMINIDPCRKGGNGANDEGKAVSTREIGWKISEGA